MHTITSTWPAWRMYMNGGTGQHQNQEWQNTSGFELIYAGGHCHAPTCIDIELYNADTGELLCRNVGVYGGTGARTIAGSKWDEPGYLAIPPCLWGSKEEGLMEPVLLGWNATLKSVKRANSTYGHSGEMALWQMRGTIVS